MDIQVSQEVKHRSLCPIHRQESVKLDIVMCPGCQKELLIRCKDCGARAVVNHGCLEG